MNVMLVAAGLLFVVLCVQQVRDLPWWPCSYNCRPLPVVMGGRRGRSLWASLWPKCMNAP
jgi:hypothetical protein